MMITRSLLVLALLAVNTLSAENLWNGEPGVVHIDHAPRGSMIFRDDGSLILFSEDVDTPNTPLTQAFVSTNGGRTWGKPFVPTNAAGRRMTEKFQAALKLNSGKIGLVTGGETPPLYWQVSSDGGLTFSDPVTIVEGGTWRDDHHRNQITQLRSGRIVFPVYSMAGRKLETTWNRAPWTWSGMCYSYILYSDDEGKTWRRSRNEVVVVLGYWTPIIDGFAAFEEPTAIELRDGRVMMIGRNRLGRLFQSFSSDGGVTWGIAEPMELASSYAPAEVRRIPTTGDLLIAWNQVSKQEIIDGLNRHRLSVAISADDGKTWSNFKNLYSLDDYNYVQADKPQIIVPGDRWVKHGLGKVGERGVVGTENVYVIPEDRSRYRRRPASLRTCYPMICFTDKDVLVSYAMGTPDPIHNVIDIFPIDWLYKPIVPKGPYRRLMVNDTLVKGADMTVEDGTEFAWADAIGDSLGDFEPPPKHVRVALRLFLETYGAHVVGYSNGTLHATFNRPSQAVR